MELLVYLDDQLVPARDASSGAGLPEGLDLGSSSLRFEVDGREYAAGEWNLGPVSLLVDQIEVGVRRLERGEPAIVRSAVLDRTGVPFHLFEPKGDHVLVSRFFLDHDPDIEDLSPVGDDSPDARELYAYVAAHRDELLRPEPAVARRKPVLVGVSVPTDQVVASLHEVVADGRRLLASRAAEPAP
jgi:hypothetical protein